MAHYPVGSGWCSRDLDVVPCKGVSLACYGWWVVFGYGFKTKTNFFSDAYVFCMMIDEDSQHMFMSCYITKGVYGY
jgi:hypothetical protein